MAADEVQIKNPVGQQETLLPHPVAFVCSHPQRWPELFNGSPWPTTLDAVHERVVTHEDLAIVQTAVMLRGAGVDVSLVTAPVTDAINVVSSVDLRISDRTAQRFVVAFRSDWARPYLADLTLTMNAAIATRRSEQAMPHWIQTGLVPRDSSRPPRVEILVFKGDLVNLAAEFRSPALLTELNRRGVRFEAHVFDPVTERSNWHDYRRVDAVIAVRDIPGPELATKPASKLVNAWAAGVPALLGVEPAFREHRISELDYVELTHPEELLGAIDRLNAEPEQYRAMVDNGRLRAQQFSAERTTQRWLTFLRDVASPAYERWSAQPRSLRSARFAARALAQRVENQRFQRAQGTR